jgi:hypothetical protein
LSSGKNKTLENAVLGSRNFTLARGYSLLKYFNYFMHHTRV